MLRKRILSVLLAAALLAAAVPLALVGTAEPSADTQVWYDGAAEINKEGYRTWGTKEGEGAPIVANDTEVTRDGKPSLRIETQTDEAVIQDLYINVPNLVVEAGTKIRISGYIKTEGLTGSDGTCGARFVFMDGDKYMTDPITGTTDWTYVEKEFTVAERREGGDFFYSLKYSKGKAWFQGFRVEKITDQPYLLYDSEAESNKSGYRTWGTKEGDGAPVVVNDTEVTHDGKPSIKIQTQTDETVIQDLYVSLPGTFQQGEKIRISGYIKTEGMTGNDGSCGARFVFVDGDKYMTDPITGTTDWTYVEKEIVLETAVTNPSVFYSLKWSKGTAWFQGFRVEKVVEEEKPPVDENSRPKLSADSIAKAPELDGAITEEEWGAPVADFAVGDPHVSTSVDGAEAAELPDSVKLYIRWDSRYLYVGAQVDDPVHYNAYTNENCWNGDAYEFDIGFDMNDQNIRYRTTAALLADGSCAAYQYEDLTGDTSVRDFPGRYKVAREGTITTYELAYEWSRLKSGAPKKGDQLYLNCQLHVAGDGDSEILGSVKYGYQNGEVLEYPLVTLTGDADTFIDDSGVLKYSLYPSRMQMRSNAGCTGANMGTDTTWATWSPAKGDPEVPWAPNISVDTTVKHGEYESIKFVNADSSCTTSSLYTAVLTQPGDVFTLTGWIKTENVTHNSDISANDKDRLGARFSASYYTEEAIEGEMIDAYRIGGEDIAPSVYGTSDWKQVTYTFRVPENARVMKFGVDLWAATGTAWFSEIRLTRPDGEISGVLYDGEAEENLSGYTTWCFTTNDGPVMSSIVKDETVTRDGKPSLKFSATESSMADLYIPLTGTLKAGESLKISGYIKTENLTGEGARLSLRTGTDTVSAQTDLISGTRDWTYVEKVFTAEEDVALKDLIYSLTWAQGTAWFQGVKVEKTTEEADDDFPYLPPIEDDDIFQPGDVEDDDPDGDEPTDGNPVTGDAGTSAAVAAALLCVAGAVCLLAAGFSVSRSRKQG